MTSEPTHSGKEHCENLGVLGTSAAELCRRIEVPVNGHPADLEDRSRLANSQLAAFRHLPGAMDRNSMVCAKAQDPRLRPCIATSGLLAEPVERGGVPFRSSPRNSPLGAPLTAR